MNNAECAKNAEFGMRNAELNPVALCGCGGEAVLETDHDTIQPVAPIDWKRVRCNKCNIRTTWRKSEAEAIEAWNTAMGAKDTNVPDKERTAKVEQAVPNMTILKRKVDLQSILQAIKTDKIRVWLNYDGKICFQNTKTGNEISVEPYYDMEGNTNNE